MHDLSQHAKPTRTSIIFHANHTYCIVKHKTNRTLDRCASATVPHSCADPSTQCVKGGGKTYHCGEEKVYHRGNG